MKKYIFLEGLPGIGKTTIINYIKKNYKNINVVDEIINKSILENNSFTEEDFIKNDEMKLNKYNEGIILLDRGPISSLSYSQVKQIIDINYDISKANKVFDKNKNYLYNSKIIYLTNNGKNYFIPNNNIISPYSSIENQSLLETISIFNCKKYCNNVVIINYDRSNMEEVINEIIN